MNWRTCLIGEFVDSKSVDIQTGPFGTQLKASDYVADGTPVINVRNIGYANLRPEKLEFVGEQVANRLHVHLLRENDIVFGRKGAVDRHLFVTSEQEKWMQGSDCIRMRIENKEILPLFVSYAFLLPSHQQWMLTQSGNKATMASLNQDIIKRIPLKLPPLQVQTSIVQTLSTYDDLIENNRRRMGLLEDAARQVYQEWFVRLRFPGCEHTHIVDGVPEGWKKGIVSDFYETSSGGTPSRKRPEYFTGEILWVKTQELHDGFIIDTDEKITEAALKNSSAKLFSDKTILVALYGATIGKIGILAVPATTNQACCAIIPKDKRSHYIHAFLFFRENKERLIGLSAGAAQNNISQQIIKGFEMITPTPSLMKSFTGSLEPVFEQWLNLHRQNQKLRTARDLLLPKLMSGEISV